MTTVAEICLEIIDENVSRDRNIAVKFLDQKYFFDSVIISGLPKQQLWVVTSVLWEKYMF